MEIRHLQQTDDSFAISNIYEQSWKFAYKNIVPQSYLESIPNGKWAAFLNRKDVNTLVMIENDIFIGTSSYGKSRFADLENYGEIDSIYLLPEYMGKGFGKKLIFAVIDELVRLNYKDIFLWVLEDNIRARRFYEKCGFKLSSDTINANIGGKELKELRYCIHI